MCCLHNYRCSANIWRTTGARSTCPISRDNLGLKWVLWFLTLSDFYWQIYACLINLFWIQLNKTSVFHMFDGRRWDDPVESNENLIQSSRFGLYQPGLRLEDCWSVSSWSEPFSVNGDLILMFLQRHQLETTLLRRPGQMKALWKVISKVNSNLVSCRIRWLTVFTVNSVLSTLTSLLIWEMATEAPSSTQQSSSALSWAWDQLGVSGHRIRFWRGYWTGSTEQTVSASGSCSPEPTETIIKYLLWIFHLFHSVIRWQ